MVAAETQEMVLSDRPDRLIMVVPNLSAVDARRIASQAVREARRRMPKATGQAASRLGATYGDGFFGITWQDNYTWFNENGVRAFTMTGLVRDGRAKVIPMWIEDPTGAERARNPRARTRTTLSGKSQVLIFRRVSPVGTRKTTQRRIRVAGQWQVVTRDVPASYPGAPGRVATREAPAPHTTPGRRAGAIARGNIGVRWRYPGLQPRMFLNTAMTFTAQWNEILPTRLYVADFRWQGMRR